MKANFDPQTIEASLYETWEQAGYFAPNGNGPAYSIMIPPPNVTGSLHMGHAFQHTLMDTLIRFQRMQGKRALWQMGTDHAGIATQMLVERQVLAEGGNRHDMGREAFEERVWQWKEESGGNITAQLRRMGSSLDWSRERFTMDEGFSTAVLEVFVQLFDEGLIYRGQRLVNWDPELETAISDLEVENSEENGSLWHFRYPLVDAKTADGKDYLVVATTRPETMLGDSAVAVHPDDERFQDLVGKFVELPLTDRKIPIIADSYVDPEFGSGCVKITPAHDFNDNEMGKRHSLEERNVFTSTAHINDEAPEAYIGLDRYVARKRIVKDLDALGLLDEIKDHKLMVPRGDRSGAVIEPWLADQWYVAIESLAKPAIEAVESGAIEFVPASYANTYFAWMRDIQDWAISRQQWWGHRIPAYYDEAGKIYVGRSEAEVRAKNNLADDVTLRQDEDVLDTWFSSALWTFATLGWPEETEDLAQYHPTDVLVTGHDIIFFWVARMIMMTLKFTGEVPFKKVYITGLVRDGEGQKMSKSKGNGLDPLDFMDGISLEELIAKRTTGLMQPQMAKRIEKATRKDFPKGIEAYGTDAMRFTFCALASTGRDVRFDTNRIEGYRNFCNKLWNASRYVLEQCDGFDLDAERELSLADRWILTELGLLVEKCELAVETYRFDLLATALYEFTWGQYCDWYLELTKPLLWDEDAEAADPKRHNGARHTLLTVLESLLRIAHPVIPFITEALWTEVAPKLNRGGDTIMIQQYPSPDDQPKDEQASASIAWLQSLITGVRNIRGEANLKETQQVPLLLQGGSERDRTLAAATNQLFTKLAKLESVTWIEDDVTPPLNALALVGDLKVMVPLAGLIDVEAEIARLQKKIDKAQGDVKRVAGKLGNAKFVDNAPPEVVAKEREKQAEAEAELETLLAQLEALKAQG